MEKIFYNSSMPRAGSTLLQNIIGQNPDFYVTPTSGVLELIFAARANYTKSPEFKAQDQELMKKAFMGFCKEGVNGYFNAITGKKYVVDKSRGWAIHYNLLSMVMQEDPKIICIVRDLRDIIASMEKIYRNNQHLHDDIISHGTLKGTTVGKRVDIWLSSPPIGLALERMHEIIHQRISEKMHFVKYEDLLTNPQKIMDGVYNYLNVPVYKHDFKNIPQLTIEDDAVYGLGNIHTIQSELGSVKHSYKEVLGEGISEFLKNKYKWYFDLFDY